MDDRPSLDAEASRVMPTVEKIVRDAGVDPSVVHPVFIRSRVEVGLCIGFSPHETVAFIARDWPAQGPESAAQAERLFQAAVSAVDRDQARLSVLLSASQGLGMVQAASLLVTDPDGQIGLKLMLERRAAAAGS
jgi:hypothetical protein